MGPNTTLSVAPGTPEVPVPPDQLPAGDQLVSPPPVQNAEPARAGTTDSIKPSRSRPLTTRPTTRRPRDADGNREQKNDAHFFIKFCLIKRDRHITGPRAHVGIQATVSKKIANHIFGFCNVP